jgi:hypothetical protein
VADGLKQQCALLLSRGVHVVAPLFDPCVAEWMLCTDANPSTLSTRAIAASRFPPLHRALEIDERRAREWRQRQQRARREGGGVAAAAHEVVLGRATVRDLLSRVVFRCLAISSKLEDELAIKAIGRSCVEQEMALPLVLARMELQVCAERLSDRLSDRTSGRLSDLPPGALSRCCRGLPFGLTCLRPKLTR